LKVEQGMWQTGRIHLLFYDLVDSLEPVVPMGKESVSDRDNGL
jgi:hypothetical protein